MTIAVIDGQGGRMGALLVEAMRRAGIGAPHRVLAIGTNALATSAMLRAGADQGATGENAIVVCARQAELILAPIGMVLCDAMLGEVTATMAAAVGSSPAHKILIPISRCQTTIAGLPALTLSEAVSAAVQTAVGLVRDRQGTPVR